jgi:hypothetical protein
MVRKKYVIVVGYLVGILQVIGTMNSMQLVLKIIALHLHIPVDISIRTRAISEF